MNRDLLIGQIGGSAVLWAWGQGIPLTHQGLRQSSSSIVKRSRKTDACRRLNTATRVRRAHECCDSWQPAMDASPEAKTISV